MHKGMVSAVSRCRPVFSRLISIDREQLFLTQLSYRLIAPTTGHDDSEVGHFQQQLKVTIDQTPNEDIWLYNGLVMLKLGRMHRQTWKTFVDPTAMSKLMREVSDF